MHKGLCSAEIFFSSQSTNGEYRQRLFHIENGLFNFSQNTQVTGWKSLKNKSHTHLQDSVHNTVWLLRFSGIQLFNSFIRKTYIFRGLQYLYIHSARVHNTSITLSSTVARRYHSRVAVFIWTLQICTYTIEENSKQTRDRLNNDAKGKMGNPDERRGKCVRQRASFSFMLFYAVRARPHQAGAGRMGQRWCCANATTTFNAGSLAASFHCSSNSALWSFVCLLPDRGGRVIPLLGTTLSSAVQAKLLSLASLLPASRIDTHLFTMGLTRGGEGAGQKV